MGESDAGCQYGSGVYKRTRAERRAQHHRTYAPAVTRSEETSPRPPRSVTARTPLLSPSPWTTWTGSGCCHTLSKTNLTRAYFVAFPGFLARGNHPRPEGSAPCGPAVTIRGARGWREYPEAPLVSWTFRSHSRSSES